MAITLKGISVPLDILHHRIFPALRTGDVLKFQTDQTLRESPSTKPLFDRILRDKFIDKHGALGEREKDLHPRRVISLGIMRAKKNDLEGCCFTSNWAIPDEIARLNQLLDEFMTRPLDPAHPLQDLRNRCLRVGTIEIEYRVMMLKVPSIILALDNDSPARESLQQLKIRWAPFVTQNVVKFSETECRFNGTAMRVQILAKFLFEEPLELTLAPMTEFYITPIDSEQILGRLLVERAWDKNHLGSLSNPHLIAKAYDLKGPDWPISRLLARIIFELFDREPEERFKLVSDEVQNPLLQNYCFKLYRYSELNSCLENLRHTYLTVSSMVADFYKSPTQLGTKFAKKSEAGNLEPAYYPFDPVQRTWENVIQTAPLLGNSAGPVLPKFFYRNPLPNEA